MTSLTIISWNIYRNNRPARIEQSLRAMIDRHAPDALLIQEAPVYETHRFSEHGLFDAFEAHYAPVHVVTGPGSRHAFTSTGQLTLSRERPVRQEIYPLPDTRRAVGRRAARTSSVRRVALYLRLAAAGRSIGLYNVHLENRTLTAGRLAQVRHLLGVIEENADDVVVVGGDFNTFLTGIFERSLHLFEEHGFTNLFTATGWRWLPRLDYFMVRGADAARGVELRAGGSDHRPILATVAF